MNLRPSGYEPDELPDCSTPHQGRRIVPGYPVKASRAPALLIRYFFLSSSIILRYAGRSMTRSAYAFITGVSLNILAISMK